MISDTLKFCYEKIRTGIPNNLLKICEIGGICGSNFGHLNAAEQDARENLDALAQEISKKGIKVQAYLRVGYPFDEIVLMANHFHVDLIIIGSHGRGGFARLLVGSTAERVVEHAPCPVLVVKALR
jgi:nucleotide-binding universal stress UspA family protein